MSLLDRAWGARASWWPLSGQEDRARPPSCNIGSPADDTKIHGGWPVRHFLLEFLSRQGERPLLAALMPRWPGSTMPAIISQLLRRSAATPVAPKALGGAPRWRRGGATRSRPLVRPISATRTLAVLLEELASGPQAGVTVLTTRFPLPDLERRPTCRIVNLATLTPEDSRSLLTSLGVRGKEGELDAAALGGRVHAKAVELLATWLVRFHAADAKALRALPESPFLIDASPEEIHVLRVLCAFQLTLAWNAGLLALATAFRDPPTEDRLLPIPGQ